MKNSLGMLALGLVMTVSSATGFAAPSRSGSEGEREVNVGVSSVFVPSGFDSRSEVNVVASGLFPNSCYRWSRAEVSRNADNVVEVHTKAKVREGVCLMVLLPFTNEVSLGRLGSGRHTVHFMGGDGTYLEKIINIE
jgi:hypothetical protein